MKSSQDVSEVGYYRIIVQNEAKTHGIIRIKTPLGDRYVVKELLPAKICGEKFETFDVCLTYFNSSVQ